ncbi:unnamed protein product, partial [Ectocarpus sp. 12 AP-2014]
MLLSCRGQVYRQIRWDAWEHAWTLAEALSQGLVVRHSPVRGGGGGGGSKASSAWGSADALKSMSVLSTRMLHPFPQPLPLSGSSFRLSELLPIPLSVCQSACR